jgi:glucosamine kinase
VDVGGTSARARLTLGGQVLAHGESHGGNFRQVGPEATVLNVITAVRHAFRTAGLPFTPEACHVHAGVAGLATPADERTLAAVPHPFARLDAQGDALLTLGAVFGGDAGVLLIVGTGCIALSRGQDGRVYRRMGWGFPLEEGGGADLGLTAVRLGLNAWEDGRDGLLASALRAEFATPRALMEWARGRGGGDYARFAPLLFDAADDGDVSAQDALAGWRRRCLDLVTSLMREGGADTVCTWGGLADRLGWAWTEPRWRAPRQAPLEWAAMLAGRGLQNV